MEFVTAAHISSLSTKCGTGARQRDKCACERRLGVNSNAVSAQRFLLTGTCFLPEESRLLS